MISKIAIKLFVENDTFEPAEFVPVFHRWIQQHAIADHLLIDVADYAHVPAGPGTLVVASEANIHMDRNENQLGLLYQRKLPAKGATTFAEQLAYVIKQALAVAKKMENEPEFAGRLKFKTDGLSIRLNDRLQAPNTVETFSKLKGDIEQAIAAAGIADAKIAQRGAGSQKLFEITVKTQGEPVLA